MDPASPVLESTSRFWNAPSPERFAPPPPPSPLPRFRYSTGKVGYESWKRFVDHGSVEGLDPVLADSWRHCAALGVSTGKRPPVVRPFGPSGGDEVIVDMSRRIDGLLRPILQSNGLMVSITDAEGRLVRSYGHKDALRRAEKLRFCTGAEWTESSVGTNAIGTALRTGYVVQIFDREHFCIDHQEWRCTAAPFFDPLGRLAGCFDISSGTDEDHAQALRLVLWSVRAFEGMLLQSHSRELESWPAAMLAALPLNGGDDGVVVIQAQGRICGVNEVARAILGDDSYRLAGRHVSELFEAEPLARLMRDTGGASVAVRALGRPGIIAEAMALRSPAGLWLGAVLKLAPLAARRDARAKVPASDQESGTGCCPTAPFIGDSEAARQIRRQIAAFARTPSTVVILGESGTGKELVARGIHCAGDRWRGPFVAINCGALPRDLIQSELFGYESGTFTGADRKGRAGVFERANRGTLFLDEICELPLEQQTNLLRVLEERRVTRLGGSQAVGLDIKIVAATNRDMAGEVQAGRFRADLFHRLCVSTIVIPPLKERGADIRPLVDHHFARLCRDMGLSGLEIDGDVYDALAAHAWPGNVRELINAVEYALNQYFIAPYARLSRHHLPAHLAEARVKTRAGEGLREAESRAILQELARHDGNISRTAQSLGIGRNTLYAKLRRLRDEPDRRN